MTGFGFGDASLTLTKSGKILCLMACGNGPKGFRRGLKETALSTSDDGGITWSDVRIIPFPEHLHSAFITSGKGFVDKDGDILLSACVLDRDYPDPMPVPWPVDAHLFYSKDDGQTWTLQPEIAYHLADESKLVQLPDGRLLISSRRPGYGPRGFNAATKGDDGIYHWDEQRVAETLPVNPCNADIIAWKKGLLLHSYIKNDKERKGLTMAVSHDDGLTWKDVLTIQEGPAAYSTMVVFKNGDVGILYEDGTNSHDDGYDIVFSRISRRLIKESIKAAK